MKRCAVVFGAALLIAGCATGDKRTAELRRAAAFLRAAEEGALGTIRSMLDDTPELVHAKDANGNTALWFACLKGREAAVELLLSRGADVNAQNQGASTALHAAALFSRADVIAPLLAGAGRATEGRIAPLLSNAAKRRRAIAAALLDSGARIDAKNALGFTPLHIAALANALEVAGLLLEKGADTEVKYERGTTALVLARAAGHEAMADLIHSHAARFGRDVRWFDPASEPADGKVIFVDRQTGVAVGIGRKQGVRKGIRFDVYSAPGDGPRVRRGRLTIEEVLNEISRGRLDGGGDPTRLVKKGDVIVSPAFTSGPPKVFVADSVFSDARKKALGEALGRCGSALARELSRRMDYFIAGSLKGDLFDRARGLGVVVIRIDQLEPYLGR